MILEREKKPRYSHFLTALNQKVLLDSKNPFRMLIWMQNRLKLMCQYEIPQLLSR